jgi:hypothetical protein
MLDFKALEASGRADRATRSLVMDTAKATHLKSYNLTKYLNQVCLNFFRSSLPCGWDALASAQSARGWDAFAFAQSPRLGFPHHFWTYFRPRPIALTSIGILPPQCNVAKAACEKRIFTLGGPDYRLTSHLEDVNTGLGRLHRSTTVRNRTSRRRRRQNSDPKTEAEAAQENESGDADGMNGPSLTDVLEDGLGAKYFLDYVTEQHLDQNLRFWSAARGFRKVRDWSRWCDGVIWRAMTPTTVETNLRVVYTTRSPA